MDDRSKKYQASDRSSNTTTGGEVPEPGLNPATATGQQSMMMMSSIMQHLQQLQQQQQSFQLQTQQQFEALFAQQRSFQHNIEERIGALEQLVSSNLSSPDAAAAASPSASFSSLMVASASPMFVGGGSRGAGGGGTSMSTNYYYSSNSDTLSSSGTQDLVSPGSGSAAAISTSNNQQQQSVFLSSAALVLTQGGITFLKYSRPDGKLASGATSQVQYPLVDSAPAIQRILRFASRDTRRFAQLTTVSLAWHEVGRVHGVPVMRNLLKLQGESLFHRLCRAGVPWLLQHAIDSWKVVVQPHHHHQHQHGHHNHSNNSSGKSSNNNNINSHLLVSTSSNMMMNLDPDCSTITSLVAASRYQFAAALKNYYERYVPERVSRVFEIIDKYEGSTVARRKLLDMLQDKYGVLPNLPTTVVPSSSSSSPSSSAPAASASSAAALDAATSSLPAPLNMAVILALDRKFGGKTAAMIAVEKQHLGILRLVHASGGTLGGHNNDGFTCTMTAAYQGASEMVRFLAQQGAPVTEKNNDGFTPAILAAYKGHVETLKVILEYGGVLTKKECRSKRIKVSSTVAELLPENDDEVDSQRSSQSTNRSLPASPDHVSIDMTPKHGPQQQQEQQQGGGNTMQPQMLENPLDDL